MEILALIGLLSAGVWGMLLIRWIGLWGMAIVSLFAATLLGHTFFHLSMLTIDRALIALTLAGIGVAMVRGQFRLQPLTRWDLLFYAFILVLCVNTLIFDWRKNDQAALGRLLFYYLLPAGFYFVARHFPLEVKHIKSLMVSLALLGVYLSLTAIAEKFEWRWAVFPGYILDPHFDEFYGRARGPLLNPSGNGVLLAMSFTAFLMLIAWTRGVTQRGLLLTIPLFLIGFVATLTRCVWLAGLIPLVAAVLIIVPPAVRRPMIAMMFLGGVIVVGMSVQKLSGFKRDKNVSVSEMKQSAELRPILATVAYRMFLDRPWMGCGLADYMEASRPYFSERHQTLVLDKGRPYVQHNIFLSLLTETGLLGLVPFLVCLSAWGWHAWKLWRQVQLPLAIRQFGLLFLGTLQGFLVIGMFQDVMIIPAINLYVFFLAGCLTQLVTNPLPRPAEKSPIDRASLELALRMGMAKALTSGLPQESSR